MTRLRFAPVERGFYDEAARRANQGRAGEESGAPGAHSFAARYDAMRQLCCHPAVADGWARHLADEEGGGGGGRGGGGGGGGGRAPLLSLDELRERMVQWKADEIQALAVTLTRALTLTLTLTLTLPTDH